MVTEPTSLEVVHFEHRLWVNELSFFADELKIYEQRLERLVLKSDDKQMLSELEHFQNQFIRQKEVLDTLQHDIHVHEQKISEALERGEDAPMDPDYHAFMNGQMESFRKIYGELKKSFFAFLLKWK